MTQRCWEFQSKERKGGGGKRVEVHPQRYPIAVLGDKEKPSGNEKRERENAQGGRTDGQKIPPTDRAGCKVRHRKENHAVPSSINEARRREPPRSYTKTVKIGNKHSGRRRGMNNVWGTEGMA